MRTPYLGDTISWEFADEDERESYLATRKSEPYSPWLLAWIVPLSAFLLFLSIARRSIGIPTILLLALTTHQMFSCFVYKRHKLTGLTLTLLNRRFMLQERYGSAPLFRDRSLCLLKSKHLKSAQWVSDGCLLVMNRWFSPVGRVLLHRGLFSSQESLDALQRWADAHGIEIAGVPPLPGGYVRPIEERRGL
ncbi:MAG: hypothetical protein WD716_13330 [Fimbriimonadaceae bacterium]